MDYEQPSMSKLQPADLMSLERYARERTGFRSRVMAHKKNRQLTVGPNSMWLFEDRLTVQYQIQEMLRTERIFEAEGIAEELEAYNPLIPDGRNFKVTLLLEFPDPEIRKVQLEKLRGVEDRCYVQVAGCERLFAIAEYLRGRRTGVTAETLAERFEVTVRTVYRDLDALRRQRQPAAPVADLAGTKPKVVIVACHWRTIGSGDIARKSENVAVGPWRRKTSGSVDQPFAPRGRWRPMH